MHIEEFKTKYNYDSATPVMRQYLDIKFANIECLVLFRMGDFYELFYEDAITASRVLGIALTKRGKSGGDEIAMCGVPHHALENYLNKLLEDDFKVAICDQTETPEEAKKRGGYKAVVNRSISRIITPGTIIEESLIEAGEPNYLASVVIDKNDAAIAKVDLSTSAFSVINIPASEIINELARIAPKEVIMAEKHRSEDIAEQIGNILDQRISFQVDSFFSNNKCKKIILDFYKIQDLLAIGHLSSSQTGAIGGILEYITLTQKENLPRLEMPKIISFHKFMSIDASTRRNLEIVASSAGSVKGSLFHSIDACVTKNGRRLLYNNISAPLIDINAIEKRLNITQFFYDNLNIVDAIRNLMKKTGDLERCIARLNMGRSTPKDLLSIKYTIEICEQIMAEFVQSGVNIPTEIKKIIDELVGLDEIYNLINDSIREDAQNVITNGQIINLKYNPKVAELHDLIENGKSAIEQLRNKYRAETGVETLKINNNNVIGLFIDVTSRHADKIVDEKFIHRQSTATSARYTTIELQELESKMVNASSLVQSLEHDIYVNICSQVIDKQLKLYNLANAISDLDVYSNFAFIADEKNYCRPSLSKDLVFDIQSGRHPVVENSLSKSNESFIANDCKFSMDERVWLITGPNMAGKSTFLRQNALITILAHIGCFVPAASATIGVVDKIFSRIGSGDDLNKGQSTFMLEMLETASILSQSTSKSLIILDEVGRGTSTYDGVAIAWSVLEHIHDKIKARCLFATHYHELTQMDEILPALKNYTVDIEDSGDEIVFLHKIKKGAASKSYGVHVAKLAGLPRSVINKAKTLLKKFEKDSVKNNSHILKEESYSMNLFESSEKEILQVNESYEKLYNDFLEVDPDKLSPKEALDLLYQLKGNL